MALSGLHVHAGYVGSSTHRAASAGLLGRVIWSETMASPGTTAKAAPDVHDVAGEPMFQVYAGIDAFIAAGPAPNATTGARIFVPGGTRFEVYVQPGDKLAWVWA